MILLYHSVISYNQAYAGTADFYSCNDTDISEFSESKKENLNEQDTVRFRTAASENVVPDLPSDIVIQVGAFISEYNAKGLRLRLSGLINQKVVLIPANGFFKVRITGCQTYEEMGRLVEALLLIGIKDVWIFRNLPKEEIKINDSVSVDTALNPLTDRIEVPVLSEKTDPVVSLEFNLQVGVFHSKAKAKRAKRRIISRLDLPVKILQEWEYYIVFVTGFKSREEIYMYYPKLAALGYTESFMVEKPVISKE
jgi:hypothetical protein